MICIDEMAKLRVIVHGGAFNIADFLVERYKEGTQEAAKTGYEVLKSGGNAVEAVCAAVMSLENNPVFNAGYGAVLTDDGTIEMDALIMDGRNLGAGAVGCVSSISNPVALAKEVMTKSPHILLVADGAIKFAKKIGHPVLEDPSTLICKEAGLKITLDPSVKYSHNVLTYFNKVLKSRDIEELETLAKKMSESGEVNLSNGEKGEMYHDTVGAVAMDAEGNIACATSTGGIPAKMPGRVGDTPLVGCGGYANKSGGASSTGHGESLTKSVICRQLVFYLEQGDSAQQAAQKAVNYMQECTGGRGGIICIDKEGNIGKAFTTYRMGWASIDENGIQYGINHGEELGASF